MQRIHNLDSKLLPRIRSEKVAPSGQLSEPKLELQLFNRDKTEITNCKHHLILKLGQINSKLKYPNLKRDQKPIVWSAAGGSVIVICLVFVNCYLIFFKCWHPTPETWVPVFNFYAIPRKLRSHSYFSKLNGEVWIDNITIICSYNPPRMLFCSLPEI
jgi:hypothetical protein